jgi:hypothetical protein
MELSFMMVLEVEATVLFTGNGWIVLTLTP